MSQGDPSSVLRESQLAPRFSILSDSVIAVLDYILILPSLGGLYQSVYIYIQVCTDWCHLLGGDGVGI